MSNDNDPIDERVLYALIDEFDEDEGQRAFDAIRDLLRQVWDDGHFCDAMDEREGLPKCDKNPFKRATSPTPPPDSGVFNHAVTASATWAAWLRCSSMTSASIAAITEQAREGA